jgi:hypothetical protein
MSPVALDGTVRLWDIRTGSPVRILGNGGIISAAAVSTSGLNCRGLRRWNTQIWDLISGVLVATSKATAAPSGLRVFRSGRLSIHGRNAAHLGPGWSQRAGQCGSYRARADVRLCGSRSLRHPAKTFVKVWDAATAQLSAEYWAGAAVETVSVQPAPAGSALAIVRVSSPHRVTRSRRPPRFFGGVKALDQAPRLLASSGRQGQRVTAGDLAISAASFVFWF